MCIVRPVSLLLAALSLTPSGASGQWLIPSWNHTLPVPIDYTVIPFFATGYDDHIFLMDGFTAWVGDVDLTTGDVVHWRPTLAPSRSYRAAVYPLAGVRVGDFIVLPHEPESLVGRLDADGSISAWNAASGLSTPRLISGIGATAASGNRIYTVGGHGSSVALGVVEMTTLEPDGTLAPWTHATPLPPGVILHDPRAEVVDAYLYVFGGEGTSPAASLIHSRNVHRAEIFSDGSLGPWVKIGDMLQARPHAGHILADGTMHVIGGGAHTYMTSTVESARIEDFGITSLHVFNTPLPYSPGLNELTTALVGPWGYVIGGSSRIFGGDNKTDVLVAQLAPLCTTETGPYRFERRAGKPSWEEVSWESCGGQATLRIFNDGNASALAYLNGALILATGDLNPQVPLLEMPVFLVPGENTLTVQLRSAPGSSLTFDLVD